MLRNIFSLIAFIIFVSYVSTTQAASTQTNVPDIAFDLATKFNMKKISPIQEVKTRKAANLIKEFEASENFDLIKYSEHQLAFKNSKIETLIENMKYHMQ